jgi:hypothetical protein
MAEPACPLEIQLLHELQPLEVVRSPSCLLIEDTPERFGTERLAGLMKGDGHPAPIRMMVELVTTSLPR